MARVSGALAAASPALVRIRARSAALTRSAAVRGRTFPEIVLLVSVSTEPSGLGRKSRPLSLGSLGLKSARFRNTFL